MKKHLQAKGEIIYDFRYDILTFKVKDRDYKLSIEVQNFVIDIDSENFVTGVRIMDASKVSNINKMVLRHLIHGEFEAAIKEKVITIRFNFVGKLRNRLFPLFSSEKKFIQQITVPISSKLLIEDSLVTVPEIVVS